MGGDWKYSALGDVLELKRGYDLPKRSRTNGDVPIISSAGLSDFHSEAKVSGPGVVTGRYGTIGEVFYTQSDFWPLNTTLYVRDFKGNDEKFIYYFLKTIPFLQYSDKAAVPGVNRNHLHLANVFFPKCVSAQKSIAHILGTLDDKIELNRKTNETLEAIAQVMFKSWFVDFDPVIDNALAAGNDIPEPFQARAAARQALGDARKRLAEEIRCEFPDEFVFGDEMGWVPRGWELSTVHDEFTLKGGATPSTKNSEYWEFGTIPWTTPKDLSDNETKIMFRTSRCITEAGLNKIGSGLLPLNTVLMSSRAPVGYLAIPKIPLAINQGYIALICDSKITATYAIQWLASIMDDIKQRAGGTTFAEISKKNFRDIPIFVPGEKCIQAYSAHVEPWYESIANELVGIDRLTQFRDTLLPKLLSGQLTVPNAEKLVAEEL